MMGLVSGRYRVLLRPMATMAVSRFVVLGALFVASLVHDDGVRDSLGMWDAHWYELIAQDGYPRNVYGHDGQPVGLFAFFPLYPLLVRGVHAISPFNWSDAASIVSFLLALLLAALLWLYVRDVRDEVTADRTVALFAFFPQRLRAHGALLGERDVVRGDCLPSAPSPAAMATRRTGRLPVHRGSSQWDRHRGVLRVGRRGRHQAAA
jgi:hypothetical protein